MDKNNALIMWVLGGLGLVLVYSAYKGISPKAVLTQSLTTSAVK